MIKLFIVVLIAVIAVILAYMGYSQKDALEMAAAAFMIGLALFVHNVVSFPA